MSVLLCWPICWREKITIINNTKSSLYCRGECLMLNIPCTNPQQPVNYCKTPYSINKWSKLIDIRHHPLIWLPKYHHSNVLNCYLSNCFWLIHCWLDPLPPTILWALDNTNYQRIFLHCIICLNWNHSNKTHIFSRLLIEH